MLNWRDPRNPLSGGAERVTQGYLNALAERGHEVFWFANDFPGAAREEKIGPIQIVRGGGMGTSVLAARRWYRKQARFDLVMDQHHGIPWYAPWWCRTNSVAYIHEVLGPIWRSFYPPPVSTIGRWQERWTHWLYRHVPFWTANESTERILREHGVQSVTIIRYGVHTVALPRLEAKPLTPPVQLVVVSRLAPNKRIDHAIRAVKHLLDQGVDSRLRIVGGGECEPALRQLAGDLQLQNQVTFTGLLSEPEKDALLRQSHFLLHTSQREGWGLNVIEANALGTPAVVYPVEGLIESTLHDQTGLVSQEETPASLAESLAGVLRDQERYERHRFNAWERAKTMHWSRVLPGACDWLETKARGVTTPASGVVIPG
ncbi:MAG TPA: glycosyltransferase family 4 protein [Verrucomicrobiae bacterium]|nr:glycosyltransferase family 4 protein [Verrucomicrobiae bacterium]